MRVDYTLDMMDALRVKIKQIPDMIERLKNCGVSHWVFDSQNTFIRTSYAPKGTVYLSKSYLEKESKKRSYYSY